MTPSPPSLVIRDAVPRDAFAITQVLTAALQDSPIGQWMDPDPHSRHLVLLRYAGALATRVLGSGIVRLIEDAGEVVAAALWSLDPLVALSPVPAGGVIDGPAGESVLDRLNLLHEVTQTRRPWHQAHQQLLLLGVRPGRQRQGLGGYLLIGHHTYLHVTGIGGYAITVDGAGQQLLERHGYSPIGPPQLLPGAVPVSAMWRPPVVADPR
ncbi:hypothetical protein [Actinoplanes sp. NPDC026623]|uniref:hypothetical protein n=1 Tax=Actinoplanes sp. NPDC026623 TaxID=3155610 RepID=UPI0033C69F6F